MRTTISLNDRLAARVRREAARAGLSVSAFIATTLDDALKRKPPPQAPPFKLVTVSGEGLLSGVDLDRPRSHVVEEDETAFARRRSETGDAPS